MPAAELDIPSSFALILPFPRDDRLQRPEYIGGSKSPVIISKYFKPRSLLVAHLKETWLVTVSP